MGKLSIKINIAERIYPLKVDASEEEFVRKAAKEINEQIKTYQSQYAVKDKQDLLAMCLLQYATQSGKLDSGTLVEDKGYSEKLDQLNIFLDEVLSI
ncbi:MAG: cell division protein ZapA (FtsZ GTPase activity inhibitor) [Sphingobacteriales bacterium]|jgi:cell division protein ZapA (FtsZ GTPase activity inhibitor)